MSIVSTLLMSYLSLAATKEHSQLNLERIFESPKLEGDFPKRPTFSPDGSHLTFLKGKQSDFEVMDLWDYDLKTGEPRLLLDSKEINTQNISEEEKGRRERQRINTKGIVDYIWSNDSKSLLLPAGDDIYLYSFVGGTTQALPKMATGAIDPNFSPKDHFVSYARGGNLYVYDLAAKKELAVTDEKNEDVKYGIAEFVAQESMNRTTGYWWSKDEQFIAFTRTDEAPVKWVERYNIDANKISVQRQRYPEAGTSNVEIQLGIVRIKDLRAGKPQITWIPLGSEKDIYLPRVEWTQNNRLAYQVQSRDQKRLDLFIYDPKTAQRTMFLEEISPSWINLNKDWRWLENNDQLLWASERSGFKHLYLYSAEGKLLRTLTSGNWGIDEVVGVDEKQGYVYFTAPLPTVLEKQLFRISLTLPEEPVRITQGEGWNQIEMDKKAQYFVRSFSTVGMPPQLQMYTAQGQLVRTLFSNEIKKGHPLFQYASSFVGVEYGSFQGPTEKLYYSLIKPPDFDPKKKYPLIVTGYGGPHGQVVVKRWGGDQFLISQILASRGYLVMSVDNRGSSRRGKKFEDYLYRALGTVEVEDQKAAVEYFVSLGFVNSKKVAFFGWSYGGYLALMNTVKASETFPFAVAVAPVTDFRFYDTHYTERYLGNPQKDQAAYQTASVLNFTSKLKSRLLLIHGMADDNVLFTNSTMLFEDLQKRGKVFDSVTYPGARHGISGKDLQLHLFRTVLDFYDRNLK